MMLIKGMEDSLKKGDTELRQWYSSAVPLDTRAKNGTSTLKLHPFSFTVSTINSRVRTVVTGEVGEAVFSAAETTAVFWTDELIRSCT